MTMFPEDVSQVIRDFLAKESSNFNTDVVNETNLFDADILDSFLFISLVAFLETRFSVTFSPADLTEENIASIASIAALVRRLSAP